MSAYSIEEACLEGQRSITFTVDTEEGSRVSSVVHATYRYSSSICRSKDSKDSQVEDDGYSTTVNPFINMLSKMNPKKTEPGDKPCTSEGLQ